MKPLISIIVPVYNVEKYLPRCLDSILLQTYSELEIILVDDGSTDLCGEICEAYALKDNRIKVIHKENGGIGSARNAGLEVYSGEFIMFVDSDDYISADAVEVLYERMISDDSDMAIGKHIDVYEDGSLNDSFCSWMQDDVLSQKEFLARMGEKNYYPVANCMKLYRQTVFEGVVYPNFTCGEDVWVFPQIVDKCKKISVVNKTLYFYFQRSNSLVHKKSEISKQEDLNAILNLVNYFWQRNISKSARKWYVIAVNKAFELENKRNCLKLFKQYFNPTVRKKLLKGESIKIRIKWISLYVPLIFSAVRCVKRILKRG